MPVGAGDDASVVMVVFDRPLGQQENEGAEPARDGGIVTCPRREDLPAFAGAAEGGGGIDRLDHVDFAEGGPSGD